MKRYRITFRETAASEPEIWHCRAYDKEHAEDKFWSSCADEGGHSNTVIASITELRSDKHKVDWKKMAAVHRSITAGQ